MVGIVWGVGCVALAPIITDSIGENAAILVESCCRDSTADRWVSLESVLGDSVPEVESAVRTSRAESSILGVERNGIDGVDVGHVVCGWISVTLE